MTTAPAAIKEWLPILWPQMTVALAPMVAPRLIRVVLNSALREINARGLTTLVKTQLGPQNTSSSRTSPS